ncbi:MAG: hypothetical protein NTW03_12610 [Verrucomicrobia bacterium]|nr:hypothetical protein [Verrucomicrobiota bacterium]
MNKQEAKQILLLYRPGLAEAGDSRMAEALALAGSDEELRGWFEQHCAFQAAMRKKFRQIEAPRGLRDRILEERKVLHLLVWWRSPVRLLAAAAIVLFLGLAGLWLKPRTPDSFADYQARMVRSALREYRMDVVTNDMRQVRQFLASKGAPADYVLPKGLAKLELTGGGVLSWRSQPVTMACFNRGDAQMLFLFVMERSGVKHPPPAIPQLTTVNRMPVASWTQGGKTYLLAGPEGSDLRAYL